MSKKIIYVFVSVVFVLSISGVASAGSNLWNNAGGDSLWHNSANWSLGVVPDIGDGHIVKMNQAGHLYANVTIPSSGKNIMGYIGTAGAPMTLDIDAAFDCVNLKFAWGSTTVAAYALIEMDDADVSASLSAYVAEFGSTGTWDMTNSLLTTATVKVADDARATGIINMDNSRIEAGRFLPQTGTMSVTLSNGSSIRGGSGTFPADLRATWQSWETNGWLQAGAGETLVYEYDNVMYTTVTAVPEPATIAILGLGSLLMIRRKRA